MAAIILILASAVNPTFTTASRLFLLVRARVIWNVLIHVFFDVDLFSLLRVGTQSLKTNRKHSTLKPLTCRPQTKLSTRKKERSQVSALTLHILLTVRHGRLCCNLIRGLLSVWTACWLTPIDWNSGSSDWHLTEAPLWYAHTNIISSARITKSLKQNAKLCQFL